MIVRPRTVIDGELRQSVVRGCVQEFLTGAQRRRALRESYEGRHSILERTRPSGLPNLRLVHDFPRYISTMAAGYLVGRPVVYESEDQQAALEAVMEMYDRCSVDSVDAELARNASIFGKGVELVFADGDALPKTAALEPERAFVVYDDTVEKRPLFGVHLLPRLNELGGEVGWDTMVYTDREVLSFGGSGLGEVGALKTRRPHFFGDVPLVEYWNDESERGDFEWVIPMIDGYDKLQSDRVNDKERFVDALLVLIGCTMEKDEQGRAPIQQLREDKMLSLPDSGSDVKYLAAQMDESGAETLRKALAEDIHRLSMVPNLADEGFSANASGVAMRYKLWGLEQLTNVKQQWFAEGLRQRLKLFINFMVVRGAPVLDVADVQIKFTRALPVNKLEQAQYVQTAVAAGAMSTEERVAALHEGEDWIEVDRLAEVERIREEAAVPDLLSSFRDEDTGEE